VPDYLVDYAVLIRHPYTTTTNCYILATMDSVL
jgi:hypothetical protein